MASERIFRGLDFATGTWTDYGCMAAFFGCVIFILVAVLIGKENPEGKYLGRLAWCRAFSFFFFCNFAALATGVTEKVLAAEALPGSRFQSPAWLCSSGFFLAVVVYGYNFRWPIGTYVGNRRFYWTTIPFGIIWGVSEAQLQLAIWSLLEMTGLSTVWVAVLQVLLSGWNGAFHSLYWDIYVSPAHNVLEWNPVKVATVHVPNLLVATVYLAVFKDVPYYVGIESISLLSAAIHQRFPPPWSSEWDGQPLLPAGGWPAAELGLDVDTLKPLSENRLDVEVAG